MLFLSASVALLRQARLRQAWRVLSTVYAANVSLMHVRRNTQGRTLMTQWRREHDRSALDVRRLLADVDCTRARWQRHTSTRANRDGTGVIKLNINNRALSFTHISTTTPYKICSSSTLCTTLLKTTKQNIVNSE